MRTAVATIVSVFVLGLAVPSGAQVGPPPPDPAFIKEVPGSKCEPESAYEAAGWKASASHQAGEKCKRIHFSFGPITVRPGQNDVLLGPVTIEKPAYDGYITRFQPDLVDETGV